MKVEEDVIDLGDGRVIKVNITFIINVIFLMQLEPLLLDHHGAGSQVSQYNSI